MAPKYAKDQPAGFTNKIENVAIVGVSSPSSLFSIPTNSERLAAKSASTSPSL